MICTRGTRHDKSKPTLCARLSYAGEHPYFTRRPNPMSHQMCMRPPVRVPILPAASTHGSVTVAPPVSGRPLADQVYGRSGGHGGATWPAGDHGGGLPGLLAKVGRREGILPLVNTRLLRVRVRVREGWVRVRVRVRVPLVHTRLLRVRGQTRLRARMVRRACRVRVQVRGSPALLLPLKPATMTRSLAYP